MQDDRIVGVVIIAGVAHAAVDEGVVRGILPAQHKQVGLRRSAPASDEPGHLGEAAGERVQNIGLRRGYDIATQMGDEARQVARSGATPTEGASARGALMAALKPLASSIVSELL